MICLPFLPLFLAQERQVCVRLIRKTLKVTCSFVEGKPVPAIYIRHYRDATSWPQNLCPCRRQRVKGSTTWDKIGGRAAAAAQSLQGLLVLLGRNYLFVKKKKEL